MQHFERNNLLKRIICVGRDLICHLDDWLIKNKTFNLTRNQMNTIYILIQVTLKNSIHFPRHKGANNLYLKSVQSLLA